MTASQLLISAAIWVSAGALKFDFTRHDHLGDAIFLAQHLSRWAKKPLVPSLPLEMKPTVLPSSVVKRGARLPEWRDRRRRWDRGRGGHGTLLLFFGGSQSTQTPIGSVTARLLLPSQGGMTAPNPPAGPPAAITSSWSGDSSAEYIAVAAVAHHGALADIGPFAAVDARALVNELGDIGLAPLRPPAGARATAWGRRCA